MDDFSTRLVVVALSEVVAAYLIWRLWRSEEHVFLKLGLSVLSLVPIFGPLLVMWIGNFPDKMPRVLQDRSRYTSDVQDRWRHVHDEPDPNQKLRKWRAQMERNHDAEP
jgi:hypothetical protein